MATERKYKDFWSFDAYYLTEHAAVKNRNLHFIGTALIIVLLIAAIVLQNWWLLAMIPVCGYGFAWVGHFFIEKDKPATFTYPLYSLGSDFGMFWHILTGQVNEEMKKANGINHNKS